MEDEADSGDDAVMEKEAAKAGDSAKDDSENVVRVGGLARRPSLAGSSAWLPRKKSCICLGYGLLIFNPNMGV